MAEKPLFKIIPDSRVKATGGGYYYVQTDPPHPHGMKLKDRKCTYIYEHIAKMELHLGRYLDLSKEQVDHKDGDKANNSTSNLELTTRGPHQHDHATGSNGHKKNKFWKTSPMNKPKNKRASDSIRAAAQKVVLRFLKYSTDLIF